MPLDKLIDTFFGIYGGSHFDLELWKIATHLMEEIGEVANEVLYLAELDQAEREGVDFTTYFANALERARGGERGLKESIHKKLREKLSEGPESTIAYFRTFIVQTMRGELADVMSWLSALLWKIGEIWRSCRIRKVGEPPQYFKFWEYVNSRFTGMQNNLGCAYCEQVQCMSWCRFVSLAKNVMGEMDNSVRHGNFAVLAILGLKGDLG